MPSEDSKVNRSGSAHPAAPPLVPEVDAESVDVVLDFDAAEEAPPASPQNPSTPGQKGGKDAPEEPGCGCGVSGKLSAGQLAQLDGALLGEDQSKGSVGKAAARFGLSHDEIRRHKSECLRGGSSPPSNASQFGMVLKKAARVSAKSAISREERVAYLACRIAAGKDAAYLTYAHLADIWGVSLATVQNYASAAHVAIRAMRGDTSHEVNRSVSMADRVQRAGFKVFEEAMRQIDPESGPDVKAAAMALGVVQKAQAQKDKATGVALGGGIALQVFRTPEFQALMAIMLNALDRYPEAKAAVLSAVKRELDAKRAGAAFDDALRLLEMSGDSPDSA